VRGLGPRPEYYPAGTVGAGSGGVSGVGGVAYVVQKCRPQRGHTQNWSDFQGPSGCGSRISIAVPQRWQRRCSPKPDLLDVLTLAGNCTSLESPRADPVYGRSHTIAT
jgi:hypothetical protein